MARVRVSEVAIGNGNFTDTSPSTVTVSLRLRSVGSACRLTVRRTTLTLRRIQRALLPLKFSGGRVHSARFSVSDTCRREGSFHNRGGHCFLNCHCQGSLGVAFKGSDGHLNRVLLTLSIYRTSPRFSICFFLGSHQTIRRTLLRDTIQSTGRGSRILTGTDNIVLKGVLTVSCS